MHRLQMQRLQRAKRSLRKRRTTKANGIRNKKTS
jgi:hypothetical protein